MKSKNSAIGMLRISTSTILGQKLYREGKVIEQYSVIGR